jgi:hypothetical protein
VKSLDLASVPGVATRGGMPAPKNYRKPGEFPGNVSSRPSTPLMSSRNRASVIMPRSPTRMTLSSPKRWRTFWICGARVFGSPVFPGKVPVHLLQLKCFSS